MMKSKKFLVVTALALTLVFPGCAVSTPPVESSTLTQEEYNAALSQIENQSSALEDMQKEVDALKEELETLKAQESSSSSEASSSSSSQVAPSVPQQAISVSASPSSVADNKNAAAPKASASSTVSSSAAPASNENAGTVFEGYNVTITDAKTPAEMALGTDWPITKLYFMDKIGNHLGSISGTAYTEIMEKYKVVKPGGGTWDAPGAGGDWEFWFAEEFNALRGVTDSSGSGAHQGNSGDTSSNPNATFDAATLASNAFDLINQERVSAGLGEVEMDSTMMDRAEMRAEELATKYDHVRPDGTRMSIEYKYGEINNRRANTAAIAVSSWMESSGHKDIILTERYNYAGIGSYKGDDGTVYWCMLFSK